MKKNALILLLASLGLGLGGISVSSLAKNEPEIVAAAANDATSYWSTIGVSSDGSVYGNSFRDALQNRMKKSSVNASYDALKTILRYSDTDGGSKCLAFYRDHYETNGIFQNAPGYELNREHCWPNSRGAGDSGECAGTDPHVIRPTLTDDNGSRGNKMYSLSGDGGWDPASLGYEAARGESARIILYTAVRWHNLSQNSSGTMELTNSTGDSSSKSTMGKLSTLLEWNKKYAVTTTEAYRNNYLAGSATGSSYSFCRNPFIDHPDWANYIWDANGIRTSPYSGGGSSSGSSSSAPESSGGDYSSSSSSSTLPPAPATKSSQAAIATSSSALASGGKYLIGTAGSGTSSFVSTSLAASYYQGKTDLPVTDGKVSPTGETESFLLGGTAGAYTLKTSKRSTDGGYLAVSGTYKNLVTVASTSTADSYATWDIQISSSGAATIKNASYTAEDRYISYSADHADFATSVASSTLYLYKEGEPVTLSSLSIASLPAKTVYKAGEAFESEGLSVEAVYSDGSKQAFDGYALDLADGTLLDKTGTLAVSVSYLGKSVSFDITIKGDGLSGGAIAGIVIGSLVGAAGLGIGVFFLIRHLKKKPL